MICASRALLEDPRPPLQTACSDLAEFAARLIGIFRRAPSSRLTPSHRSSHIGCRRSVATHARRVLLTRTRVKSPPAASGPISNRAPSADLIDHEGNGHDTGIAEGSVVQRDRHDRRSSARVRRSRWHQPLPRSFARLLKNPVDRQTCSMHRPNRSFDAEAGAGFRRTTDTLPDGRPGPPG